MADTVYRAELEKRSGPGQEPVLDRRRYFIDQCRGHFPAGRWNDEGQDTIYASQEGETAWEEKAQYFRPDPADALSLGTSDLASTSSAVVLVLLMFPAPVVSPSATHDGRATNIDRRPDLPELLAPRPEWARAQGFARPLVVRGVSRLIVPSAPAFNAARIIRWNSVFYVGEPGQVAESDLPRRAQMQEVRRGNP